MMALEDLRTLTVEEVAELLGVHAESVRRWVREGLLPAARWGRRLHFSVEAIRQFQAAAAVHVRDPADIVRRARRNRRLRDPADLVRRSRPDRTHARAAGDVADVVAD